MCNGMGGGGGEEGGGRGKKIIHPRPYFCKIDVCTYTHQKHKYKATRRPWQNTSKQSL